MIRFFLLKGVLFEKRKVKMVFQFKRYSYVKTLRKKKKKNGMKSTL